MRARDFILSSALSCALVACHDAHRSSERTPATQCVHCHMPEYLAVKHPPHVDVKPTACGVCHSQNAWHPSVVDHAWPLTGAHASATCFSCHTGKPPVFAGTPNVCIGCHADDYRDAKYPGHDRFALTCQDCHSTTAFRPARKPDLAAAPVPSVKPRPPERAQAPSPPAKVVKPAARKSSTKPPFVANTEPSPTPSIPAPASAPATPIEPERQHPEAKFPISTGPHRRVECQTCHAGSGPDGKGNTDCVQCHTRGRFDPIHADVPNYPRAAAAPNFCLNCHARGRVDR